MSRIFVVLLIVGAIALAQGYQTVAPLDQLNGHSGNRIINGELAVNGQFPHQAFLLTTRIGGSRTACSGSLISPLFVLTAARCLVRGITSQVHLGHVNYTQSPIIVDAPNLITHPKYSSTTFNNNIGLVGMMNPVFQTNTIKVIPFFRDTYADFEGKFAIVSGFGRTEDTGSNSIGLSFVGVKVISNYDCAQVFGNSIVKSSTMCAVGGGSPDEGICNGDSGSPLTIDINGVTTQIGVASFAASSGCSSSSPNGFVRTSHYEFWISSYIGF